MEKEMEDLKKEVAFLREDVILLREQNRTLETIINGINNRGGIINELEAIKDEQKKTNATLLTVSEAVTKNKQDQDIKDTAIKSYLKGAGIILVIAEGLSLFFQITQYIK